MGADGRAVWEPAEERTNRVVITCAAPEIGGADAEGSPYRGITIFALEAFCKRVRHHGAGGHQVVENDGVSLSVTLDLGECDGP